MERLVTITALSLLSIGASLGQADLRLAEAGVSNSTRTLSFGAAPSLQVGNQLYISATVDNLGSLSHSNITVAVEISGPTPVSTMVTMSNLDPGEDDTIVQPVAIPTLAEGLYTATLTVSSDQNGSETNLTNNVQVRHFKIDDGMCALDGIGVTPVGQIVVGSLGTTSFPDVEDGLILLSYVQLRTWIELEGFEALLAPGSTAEAQVHFMVLDTTDVLNQDLFNPLHESDFTTITATDVSNSRIQVALSTGAVLPPGGYYVAIEVYSQGNAYPVYIKDDVTHDEDPYASLMYHPMDGQLYSNGNALAVRLRTGDALVGLVENQASQALRVHPNPARDLLYLDQASLRGSSQARITDALGRTVMEARPMQGALDVSSLPSGAYTVHTGGAAARFVKQ